MTRPPTAASERYVTGFTVFAACCAAGSACLVWWATGPFGISLSPDGVAYLAIAESIRDRGEYSYWLEPQTSSWPPLLPTAIAMLSKVMRVPVLDAARVLAVAVHGATVIAIACVARRMLRSTPARACVVLVAAMAQPMMKHSLLVASEPLFCLLLMLIVLSIGSAVSARSRHLLVGSVMSIAAFATRYAGVAFLAAGALAVLSWPRWLTAKSRIRRTAVFAAPALIGVALIAEWNRRRTGEPFGPRVRPDQPAWLHAGDAMAAIGSSFSPVVITGRIGTVVGVVIVAGTVLPMAALARREPAAPRSAQDGADTTRVTLAVFALIYILYMVIARTFAGFERLDGRLLLPVVLPLILLMAAGVEDVARSQARRVRRLTALVMVGLLVVPALVGGLDQLATTHDLGSPYTNRTARDALAGPVVSSIPSGCALISNDAWLLWLVGQEAQFPPLARSDDRWARPMTTTELRRLLAASAVCVLWFDTGSTLFVHPHDLGPDVQVETLAADTTATLYRLTAGRR